MKKLIPNVMLDLLLALDGFNDLRIIAPRSEAEWSVPSVMWYLGIYGLGLCLYMLGVRVMVRWQTCLAERLRGLPYC